eukprot:153767_1
MGNETSDGYRLHHGEIIYQGSGKCSTCNGRSSIKTQCKSCDSGYAQCKCMITTKQCKGRHKLKKKIFRPTTKNANIPLICNQCKNKQTTESTVYVCPTCRFVLCKYCYLCDKCDGKRIVTCSKCVGAGWYNKACIMCSGKGYEYTNDF